MELGPQLRALRDFYYKTAKKLPDGQDFVQAYGEMFITRRALHWLTSVHARPFWARPARLWVDGMSDEQKSWLTRAQDVTSLGMDK